MREVVPELQAWRNAGEPVAIATVVETWGSSPRPLGSKMLVGRSGHMAGSGSNGCIGGEVFEEAEAVLASGRPKLVEDGAAGDVAFQGRPGGRGPIADFLQPAPARAGQP